MKAIIPAKKDSSRLANKNWREFYSGKNLVQIKIEQLLKCFAAEDIYISTDNTDFEATTKNYKINFIHRNAELASDNTPWPDAVLGMVNELPIDDNEEIAWVEVINPLFDDFENMKAKWEEIKYTHDSMVLVTEFNKFLMSANGTPLNFMFGKWHAMSQNKEKQYIWDSVCIMKKKDIKYFSYPIGKTPFLFTTNSNYAIDIDTLEDFEMAQYLYGLKLKHGNQ